jgi:hypothetical protein
MKRCPLALAVTGAWLLFTGDVSAQTAQVSGTVYDSVGRRFLGNALVQVVVRDQPGISRSAVTDASGRFTIDSVNAGTWVMGFYHPALDSIGLESPLLALVIRDSTAVRAALAVPSPETITRSVCAAAGDSTGLWIGRTRRVSDGAPTSGVTLVAQWTILRLEGQRVVRDAPGVSTTTRDDGFFAICGLPVEELVLARAWRGGDSTGAVAVMVPQRRLLLRDLYVGSDTTGAFLPTDTAYGVRRGPGRVRGVVRRANGNTLPNARIVFWETGTEAATSASGHYQLDSLPLGTATLEARALGYLPRMVAVDVRAGAPAVVDIVLESRQAYLDTVRVVGTRVLESPQYRGFLERKKRGFGYFMDEEAIERRNPIWLTDLFRMMPGVTIAPGSFGGQILFRGMGLSAYCRPSVFVDGMRMLNMDGAGIESFVSAHDVRGVEVYTRSGGMPAEFQTMDGCGAIVIWTGARRRQLPP